MLCQVIILFFVENQTFNTILHHRYPIKSAKCLFFNFFQRKKIGVGKSDFVRFCFAKSKTRVRHAPRHQWSCVQNGLFATGGWIAREGGNRLASLFQDEVLQQPLFIPEHSAPHSSRSCRTSPICPTRPTTVSVSSGTSQCASCPRGAAAGRIFNWKPLYAKIWQKSYLCPEWSPTVSSLCGWQ